MQPDTMWKNSLILAPIIGFLLFAGVVSAQTTSTPTISSVAWSNSDILGISGAGFGSGVWINIYRANGETSTSVEHTIVSNTLISLSGKKTGLEAGDRVQVCKKINRRDSCTPFSDPILSAPSSSTPSQRLDPVATSTSPNLTNIYWQDSSNLNLDCTNCGREKGSIYHSPGGSIEYLIPNTAIKKWELSSGTDQVKIQIPQNFDTTYQSKKVNVNIYKGDYIRVCTKSGNCSEYKEIDASLAIPSTTPTTPNPSKGPDEYTVEAQITDLYAGAKEASRAIHEGKWNSEQCAPNIKFSIGAGQSCIKEPVLSKLSPGERISPMSYLTFTNNKTESVCVRYISNRPNRWHVICKKINRPAPPAKVYNNSVSVPSDTTIQANQSIRVDWTLSADVKSDSTWIGVYRKDPQLEGDWYTYNNGPKQAPNNWVYTSTCRGYKSGQIVLEGRCDINVGNIPSGVYQLKMFNSDDFNNYKVLSNSSNTFTVVNNDSSVNARIQGFPEAEISFINPYTNQSINGRNIVITPGKPIKVKINNLKAGGEGVLRKVRLYAGKYSCQSDCFTTFFEKSFTNETEVSNIISSEFLPDKGEGNYFVTIRAETTNKNCMTDTYRNESTGSCGSANHVVLWFTNSSNSNSLYSVEDQFEDINQLSEDDRQNMTLSYPETDPEEVDY